MRIESLRISFGVDGLEILSDTAEVCAVVEHNGKRTTKTFAIAYDPDDSIAELAVDAHDEAKRLCLSNGVTK